MLVRLDRLGMYPNRVDYGRVCFDWSALFINVLCSFGSRDSCTNNMSSSVSESSYCSPVARSLKINTVDSFDYDIWSNESALSTIAETDDCWDCSKTEFSSTTASKLGKCLRSIFDLGVYLNSIKKSWKVLADYAVRLLATMLKAIIIEVPMKTPACISTTHMVDPLNTSTSMVVVNAVRVRNSTQFTTNPLPTLGT